MTREDADHLIEDVAYEDLGKIIGVCYELRYKIKELVAIRKESGVFDIMFNEDYAISV